MENNGKPESKFKRITDPSTGEITLSKKTKDGIRSTMKRNRKKHCLLLQYLK